MAISLCGTATDAYGRELLPHGSQKFPAAVYDDDLKIDPVPWHWHEEMEIGVITKGKVRICADRETYILEEGEGFYIGPGVLHMADAAIPGEQTALRSIVYNPRIISEEKESIYYEKYLRPLTEPVTIPFIRLNPAAKEENAAIQLILKAWNSCMKEEYGYEIMTRGYLSELVLHLCILTAEMQKNIIGQQTDKLRKSSRMKEMLTFIDFHYHEEISLKDIAGAANISESEALREFNIFMKQSPIRFLNEYRIQKAAWYLTNTHLPIIEICALCGFGDVSYFTKIFRRSKGLPPGKYRKNTNGYTNGDVSSGILL